MKIQKYKTIENSKFVSKDIPITKIDIKIVEKTNDDYEFDIFESKEYIYNEPKKNFSEMIDKLGNGSITKENDILSKEINNSENTNNLDFIESSTSINNKIIDISKEIDEDIYSDLKVNIEKTIEDETYLDDPYKTAIRLSQESSKDNYDIPKTDNGFVLSETIAEKILNHVTIPILIVGISIVLIIIFLLLINNILKLKNIIELFEKM